jgi:hypothetical protein
MVLTALSEKYIGLKEIDTGIYRVYYRQVELGIFNKKAKLIYDEYSGKKKHQSGLMFQRITIYLT